MIARIVVGLVGIPVIIGVVWQGFPLLTLLVAFTALWAVKEFNILAQKSGSVNLGPLTLLITFLFVINSQFSNNQYSTIALFIICLAIPPISYVLYPNNKLSVKTLFFTMIGPIYVGFLLSHSILLRELGDDFLYQGRDWLIYAILVTFSTDTGAYFIGRTFGRHKLLVSISPNKTWEGAVGGLLCAVAASCTISSILEIDIALGGQIVLGILIGIFGQIGDLLESSLKRIAHVKDSGSILPGHGGLLDRIDSLIVTIPLTYYIVITTQA